MIIMQKGMQESLKSQLKHFSRQKTPVRAIKRGGNYGKCFIRVEKRRRREIIVMKNTNTKGNLQCTDVPFSTFAKNQLHKN